MQISAAVKACLEYHQANSEKKHGQWLSLGALTLELSLTTSSIATRSILPTLAILSSSKGSFVQLE
jgi:hypothetical protein